MIPNNPVFVDGYTSMIPFLYHSYIYIRISLMTVVPLLYHCYTMVTPWLNPVDYRRVTLPHPTLAPFLCLTSVILLANTEACRSTCRFKSNSEHPKKPSKLPQIAVTPAFLGLQKPPCFFHRAHGAASLHFSLALTRRCCAT